MTGRGKKSAMGSKSQQREQGKDTEEPRREKMLDQTLADSYPASDPPSSIPDPSGDTGPDKA